MNADPSQEYQGIPIGFFKINLSDRGNLSQVAKILWHKTQKLSTTVFFRIWKKLVYSKRIKLTGRK